MPRNVAGVYTLPPVINPVVTATTIASSWANPTLSDIATALSDSIDRQGRTTILANLPMGGFKHTGAAIAANANEYVTWNQTGVKFPALGIGAASSSWVTALAVDFGAGNAAVWGGADGASFGYNTYFDGSVYRAKTTGDAGWVNTNTNGFAYSSAVSVAGGALQTFVPRFSVQPDGTTSIGGNTTVAGTLTSIGTLSAADADLTAIDCSSIGGTTVTFAAAYLTAINCSSISGTSAVFLDGSGVAGLNASNLASGTVPSARMSGSYGISITGSAATATAATDYKSRALSSATRASGIGEANTYASEAYDTGSNFDASTGRFTAPATGVYLVTWTAQANAGAGSAVSAFARVNGSTPNLGGVVAITGTMVGGAVAVPLTSGQYVSIWMSVSGGLDCNITEFQVNRIA